MPKRTDIETVLIIGAGPIIIGQACEFDYSGVQACKALKEEGYRVVLVNSNPATIMTDPGFADATYIEPISWQAVEKIIETEKPDVLLPTMGGQTALNCALDLEREGVLAKHGVEVIGAKKEAIISTPCFSSTPFASRSIATFSPVWPPRVGSRASGFSLMMIFLIISGVIGSMYVRSANSGSVMIVAGLEFTNTTSKPSSLSALQACVPE